MAKQSFKFFTPRDKPKKRKGENIKNQKINLKNVKKTTLQRPEVDNYPKLS